MNFGKRLKSLRLEKGLSQKELANIINISHANISKYESNSVEPNIEIINKLASYFDVSTDYLLARTLVRKQPDTLAFHSIPGYENLNDEDRQYVDDLINRLNKKKWLNIIINNSFFILIY